uniref:C-C motif chemokine n=1 Tax=Podarcis muralis TaxID=64176 RepID=A0A670JQZ5_PODMU
QDLSTKALSSSMNCFAGCTQPILLSLPVGSDPPTSCCFTYTAKKIPRNYIADFYETNSRCSQPGVVFTTKKGREICANPAEKWVQEYMDHFELN